MQQHDEFNFYSYHMHLVSFNFTLVDDHFAVRLLLVLDHQLAVALVSALYMYT